MKDETEYKVKREAWKLYTLAIVFNDIVSGNQCSALFLGCESGRNCQWIYCPLFFDCILFCLTALLIRAAAIFIFLAASARTGVVSARLFNRFFAVVGGAALFVRHQVLFFFFLKRGNAFKLRL